ncbi:hydrogenase maturation nickel metallochaperone HypA [Candidatus Poribacteria bacterium]|nr:hydrogenase maturation nickel metallochaperone HypA [Candidatus Poribacteria bacterium]
MHEVSLADNIIKIIKAEMEKHGIEKVQSITLQAGEMHHVEPEALRFGFKILSQDTPLEGAELIINKVPTKAKCKACGHIFQVNDWMDNCPECEGVEIEIVSGRELEILEFEGE